MILAPMVALMIGIGVHPTPILERMEPSVQRVLERVEGAGAAVGTASANSQDDGPGAEMLPGMDALPPARASAVPLRTDAPPAGLGAPDPVSSRTPARED